MDRPPRRPPRPAAPGDWRPVRTPEELAAWALAWSGDDAGTRRSSAWNSSPTRRRRSSRGTGTTAGSSAAASSPRAPASRASRTSSPLPARTRPRLGGRPRRDPADRPVVGYESGDDLPPRSPPVSGRSAPPGLAGRLTAPAPRP
ncbi:hypothetical protein O1L60_11960 [Streptomyces diastatochromogenes]|nr:hypothetical protein [Streptomyces diastatochromogenes]